MLLKTDTGSFSVICPTVRPGSLSLTDTIQAALRENRVWEPSRLHVRVRTTSAPPKQSGFLTPPLRACAVSASLNSQLLPCTFWVFSKWSVPDVPSGWPCRGPSSKDVSHPKESLGQPRNYTNLVPRVALIPKRGTTWVRSRDARGLDLRALFEHVLEIRFTYHRIYHLTLHQSVSSSTCRAVRPAPQSIQNTPVPLQRHTALPQPPAVLPPVLMGSLADPITRVRCHKHGLTQHRASGVWILSPG